MNKTELKNLAKCFLFISGSAAAGTAVGELSYFAVRKLLFKEYCGFHGSMPFMWFKTEEEADDFLNEVEERLNEDGRISFDTVLKNFGYKHAPKGGILAEQACLYWTDLEGVGVYPVKHGWEIVFPIPKLGKNA